VIWVKAHCDLEALEQFVVILFTHLVCGIWLLCSEQMLVGISVWNKAATRESVRK